MCSSSNNLQINNCSSTIGVDDFSFKKRHNYGRMMIPDEACKKLIIVGAQLGLRIFLAKKGTPREI